MNSNLTKRILAVLGLLVLLALFLGTHRQFLRFDSNPTESGKSIVAIVGTHPITLREVEQTVALPLYQADQQRSQLLHQALQQLIDEKLLQIEASRKGVTVSHLFEEASQSESVARLANIPAPVKRLSPAKTQDGVATEAPRDLQEQARVRQALLVALRRQANIHVNLPTPKPPVLSVSIDGHPSIGPVNAPVTIVEFSDFQCPYCKRSVQMVKEILEKYPDKVKVVYRDYPGPNHPYAQQAAEAARCAGDQGKFWEYHDILFDRQTPGVGWNFIELAKGIGLNLEIFAVCLNTGRYREDVAKDMQEGFRLGVTATPTFFINGRPVIGAKPFGELEAVIDGLLKQPLL